MVPAQPIKLWRPLQIYSGPKFAPGEISKESMSSNEIPGKNTATATVTQINGHGKQKSRTSIRATATQLWAKAAVALIRT